MKSCLNIMILFFALINKSYGQNDSMIYPDFARSRLTETGLFFSDYHVTGQNRNLMNPLKSADTAVGFIPYSCDSGTFLCSTMDGAIEQYRLTGDSVIFEGIIDSVMAFSSLSVCNNLDGGKLSPTIYRVNNSNELFYLDNDRKWIKTIQNPIMNLFNGGGGGNFIYFYNITYDSFRNNIIRYDGNSFKRLFSISSTISISDLIADGKGNLWLFTKADSIDEDNFLDVISPEGNNLQRFRLKLNIGNSYGAFIINKTIYIGLGAGNRVHPNTLLPIRITADSVEVLNPIPMPVHLGSLGGDMASCADGSPLGIRKISSIPVAEFRISPNPASDKLYCYLNGNHQGIKGSIIIYDIKGLVVMHLETVQEYLEIDLKELCNGWYFVQYKCPGFVLTEKFIRVSDRE